MANLTTVNGLQILATTPTGDAGQALNSNFLTIGSSLASLNSSVAALPTTYLSLSGGAMTGAITFPQSSIESDGNGGLVINTGNGEQQIEITPYQFILPSGHAISLGGPASQAILWSSSPSVVQTNNNVLDNASGNAIFSNNISASTITLSSSSTNPAHSTATSVAGSGATVHVDTQFAGASGSTAYTLNDLVTLLKTAGILKA